MAQKNQQLFSRLLIQLADTLNKNLLHFIDSFVLN